MYNFEGKTALLTGAGGEIMQAVARKLASMGANLILTDTNMESLHSFEEELHLPGDRLLIMHQDVAKKSHALHVVEASVAKFGSIDVVSPGAGFYRHQSVLETSAEDWMRTLGINLDGTFWTIQAAIPHINEGGAITLVSSMAGERGSADAAHYSAAKGGILGLTKALARQLAPRIRVNVVTPGLIDTKMVAPLKSKRGPELEKATPMGRFGTAAEVADAVIFLSSNASSFITGETLRVNGGIHIG